ncbi:MAG: sugar ABC transporter permease [Acutalibacteraceae bacterium]|nr:sugar ABC transporter permease [Acutalibacteraceae bacterium]
MSTKTKKSTLKVSNKTSYAMLSIWGILFITFIFIPVIVAFGLSFFSFDMLNTPKFNGIENYIRLFLDDDVFGIAFKNTLILALITGPIGYVLSFVFAWLINETGRTMRSILTLCFYAPVLGGNVYFIWTYIFSGDSYGLANALLLEYGLIDSPIQWLTNADYNFGICIIVIIWQSFGTGFLTFIASLQSLNKELAEAGAIDGIRNRWQELVYITFPQMKPQLLLAAVFTISGSFAVGAVNATLTGNPSTDYSTHTILLHIQDYAFTRYEMGYASAISIVLFAMMLIYLFVVNKVLARWNTD